MESYYSSSHHDVFTGIKSLVSPKSFDAFISHRGPDVKKTLALQLYNYLEERGCRTFLGSQELELGDRIWPAIENAIDSAAVQIAIFSKGYAESPWCLEELVLMLKTRTRIDPVLQTGALFIPVFYDVEPSNQGVYASAFDYYQQKGRYLDKLEEWKKALKDASINSDFVMRPSSSDHNKIYQFCKQISAAVLRKVEKTRFLQVAKHPVGVDELVKDFERQCGQDKGKGKNVKIVGIFGNGGCGKTTLAKDLFNRMRGKFDGACFLFDVKESSARGELPDLQTKLLKDLVSEDHPRFQSICEGTTYLRHRLRTGTGRFLIVLDDVDHIDQLNALLFRDELGSDSLVIVTTREERLLTCAGVNICYSLKEMDRNHAKELFCWHSLGLPYPPDGYEGLVDSFVKMCGGSPLSLRVLGGHLCGKTDRHYWALELEKFIKTLSGDIGQILKISFNTLDKEQKQMFMDTGCFFNRKLKSMAIKIWEGSGWNAEHTLQTLKNKGLVEVGSDYRGGFDYEDKIIIKMHDHLRDLGREMAREMTEQCGSPLRLWRPRDLKSQESEGLRKTLTRYNCRRVRCLNSIVESSTGCQVTYFLGNSDKSDEPSTRLMWIELQLNGGEHTSIPPWIPLADLQCLRIAEGRLQRLWQRDVQAPSELKELLLHLTSLAEFSNDLGMLNNLENLVLTGRWDKSKFLQSRGMVVEGKSLSESLKKLCNLRNLVLRNITLCGEVALSSSGNPTASESSRDMCTRKLESIEIREVKLASKVSVTGEHCANLQSLHLESMENLTKVDLRLVTTLSCLKLRFCKNLKIVSANSDLGKLVTLIIKECPELKELPSLARMSSLERIVLDGCPKLQNIIGIEQLEQLKYLNLTAAAGGIPNCVHRFQKLPSEATTLIAKAFDGAESTLNDNLFSDVIGADAMTEINRKENGNLEVSVEMPPSLSTIIICALVKISSRGEIIHIPLVLDKIDSYIAQGEWIITILLSGQEEVEYGWQGIAKSNLIMSGGEIEKGYIVTVKKGQEEKTLHIFRRIIGKLYEGIQ